MLCERVPIDSRIQTVSVYASTNKMFYNTGVRHSRTDDHPSILRCYSAMSNVKVTDVSENHAFHIFRVKQSKKDTSKRQ